MEKIYRIELGSLDLGQLLGGLESRAESWERTPDFLRTETNPEHHFFLIEDCSDPKEADGVAAHFRAIISKMR